MRARIQGSVWLECVVQPNGVCTQIQIVRSLDPTFGLDREAVAAAGQWRFAPGTRLGEPVPVLITIELTFTLR
jgi:TonB family protein